MGRTLGSRREMRHNINMKLNRTTKIKPEFLQEVHPGKCTTTSV